MKDDARLAQALLIVAALGHVAQDTDDALHAVPAAVGLGVDFHEAPRIMVAGGVELDAGSFAAHHLRPEGTAHPFAVNFVDAGDEGFPGFVER